VTGLIASMLTIAPEFRCRELAHAALETANGTYDLIESRRDAQSIGLLPDCFARARGVLRWGDDTR
jgi:hypothetical protein